MKGMPPIARRNALLDVGAAGPLAGLVVAIPILVYGLLTSEVAPNPPRGSEGVLLEGHSIVYSLLLYATHGAIPEGHDIQLTSTALAGWAGLLLTLINLVPCGPLDGGHIAYALFGARQDRFTRVWLVVLPVFGVGVSLWYATPTLLARAPWDLVLRDLQAGVHWITWGVLVAAITRFSGGGFDHPPTQDGDELSPKRRVVGWLCLVLFVLLFMPSWMRTY